MLFCKKCGLKFNDKEVLWRCPCGAPLHLKAGFSPADTSCPGIWRWLSALNIGADSLVTLGEGNTPLVKRPVGGHSAFFKLDYIAPTGSYKDRGMSVLVSWLKYVGIGRIVEDSSGNAGSSMAAYCSAGGVTCDVYVPDYTSAGKCVQIKAYGANLVRVPGTREDTTRRAEEAGAASYYASHNWNPWFLHGIKTWFLEVFEVLPGFKNIVVPVGQGSLALGAWIAMNELKESGLLTEPVRIFAVQPSACAPLAKAFEMGSSTPVKIIKNETAAEGIASAEPVRGSEVLEAVRASGGAFVTVEEAEIWAGLEDLFHSGLFVEPTSAASVAGWKKLLKAGLIDEGEATVVYLSGIGLKATDKIAEHFK